MDEIIHNKSWFKGDSRYYLECVEQAQGTT